MDFVPTFARKFYETMENNVTNKESFKTKLAKYIYVLLALFFGIILCMGLIPQLNGIDKWVTPGLVLFVGLVFGLTFGNVYSSFNKKMSKYMLQYSVVGLGFGMNAYSAVNTGKEGMLFTIVSVFGTLAIGWFVGRRILNVNRNTSYLISSGTAICGGSAIAAVSPLIKAKNEEMSVALATVFVLNAVALFIFPSIGRLFEMSEQQFGTWAAIAIHDTSSVVGAAKVYGEQALNVATTIKLTRALWIVPLAFLTSFLFKSKDEKVRIPMFIVLFVCAMLLNTYYLEDNFPAVSKFITMLSKKTITLTMFFIGSSISVAMLKNVGAKTFLQGLLLWIVISVATLLYVMSFV